MCLYSPLPAYTTVESLDHTALIGCEEIQVRSVQTPGLLELNVEPQATFRTGESVRVCVSA